ncbi:MAG TPA: hypothetical protein VFU63_15075 [Ktedonobacterales bacterium]|nr:hypothetical protein [Ktedonobacterales bacterium]
MTMWTPEEGELYEALNKIIVGVAEAREGLDAASTLDDGVYLKLCGMRLDDIHRLVWQKRHQLILVEEERRQARGKERDDATTE